ncbi:hypothetical protein D3C72_1378180 [compost metagenome]
MVGLRRQPAVDGVVAKVGAPAYEPLGEWRAREIQDRLERRFPMDAAGLFAPECIAVMYRSVMEIPGFLHFCLLVLFIGLKADCVLFESFRSFW